MLCHPRLDLDCGLGAHQVGRVGDKQVDGFCGVCVGDSQAPTSRGCSMTGILSWTGATSAFGVVVMIARLELFRAEHS